MKKITFSIAALLLAASVSATTISMKISGEGAVNDSTIAKGKKVSFDIYIENEGNYKGFTLGFKVDSKDIKTAVSPEDKGNGLNELGNIKGHNGFGDKSLWDLGGVYVIDRQWDGELPDVLGFGGVSKTKPYKPHEAEKKLSFELIFNESGTIVVDSSFFPPTGKWMFAPPSVNPEWNGPYLFQVK
ncbi:MAG: hypothetical protein DWP97_10155 [Calditrichaeota bacterium]|nr:MAG: hypothetical protein DWP97_10155 [Calditrichota bacterium]